MHKRLAGFLLAAALAGCAPKHASFVKVDDVALGRVVVYRNGVAFYERRATVIGGVLTVSVPRERVDDFLKSLTVVDAISKQPLPISIPRTQSADGPFLTMKLQLPSTKPADVVLTYVTEAPAWKSSYRVVVGDHGKVMLEGWAIVDNTSGEDWKGVIVGVGSSSALSFRYDLWSVRDVQRETLSAEERFAVAPPTGVSPYGGAGNGAGPGGEMVLTDLADAEIRRPAGDALGIDAKKPEPQFERGENRVVTASAAGAAAADDRDEDEVQVVSKSGGHRPSKSAAPRTVMAPPVASPVAQGDAKMKQLPPGVLHGNSTIVIEGYADAAQGGAEVRANDRANVVRNQLIDQGIAPARIKVVTKVAAGAPEHVRLIAQAATRGPGENRKDANGQTAKAMDTDAAPVGESHFASTTPMTVDKGSSVMVSMVKNQTDGEVVYLYDAESDRGNDKFAFRAVRFRNPTDSTLETGPVTVYGSERFIGEGLTEPIPPKSSAVVPYALDRQVVVDRNSDVSDKLSKLVTLQRGVLTAEVQHIKREQLTLTNRLREPAKVFIRHTVEKGWVLLEHPTAFERIGDAHLFEVELAPLEVKHVEISEATPIERTLDLNSDVTLGMMKVYVEMPDGSPALKAQLAGLLEIHKKLIDLAEGQDSLRKNLVDYRERMDELHDQIFTLTAVKTGGTLMAHLKDKMREMSERVSKTTIAVVDNEQETMLTRVKFQDALAELTLPDAIAPVASANPTKP